MDVFLVALHGRQVGRIALLAALAKDALKAREYTDPITRRDREVKLLGGAPVGWNEMVQVPEDDRDARHNLPDAVDEVSWRGRLDIVLAHLNDNLPWLVVHCPCEVDRISPLEMVNVEESASKQ